MLRKEDIDLIERVAIKTQKKLNSVMKESSIDNELDNLTKKEIQTICSIGSSRDKTMGEIAACLGVCISTPTTTIDRLITKEYVVRKVGEEDRRQVLISLTKKGINLYNTLVEFRLTNMQIIIDILSEEEINMFRRILSKLDSKF